MTGVNVSCVQASLSGSSLSLGESHFIHIASFVEINPRITLYISPPLLSLFEINSRTLYIYRLLWDPSKDNSSFSPGLGSRLVLSDTWVPTMRWEGMGSRRDGRRDERNILSRLGSSYVSDSETVTELLAESATSAGTERSNITYQNTKPTRDDCSCWPRMSVLYRDISRMQ